MPRSLAFVEAARGATALAASKEAAAAAAVGRRRQRANGQRGCRLWWPRRSADSIAEVAAVLKEAETKLVAITWLARSLAACGSTGARPRPRGCHCQCQVEVALSNPNGASEGRRRFGRKGGRARARLEAACEREGGREGWVRMSLSGPAAATVIWRGERR